MLIAPACVRRPVAPGDEIDGGPSRHQQVCGDRHGAYERNANCRDDPEGPRCSNRRSSLAWQRRNVFRQLRSTVELGADGGAKPVEFRAVRCAVPVREIFRLETAEAERQRYGLQQDRDQLVRRVGEARFILDRTSIWPRATTQGRLVCGRRGFRACELGGNRLVPFRSCDQVGSHQKACQTPDPQARRLRARQPVAIFLL